MGEFEKGNTGISTKPGILNRHVLALDITLERFSEECRIILEYKDPIDFSFKVRPDRDEIELLWH